MPQSTKRSPARPSPLVLFARNFFKHPKMLGSIIPSSRFLTSQLLRQVEWSRARVVVEYGPGVGTFTTQVLRRMRPDARLVVFETNPDFVRFLRQAVADPRLTVVHGSAADVGTELERLGLEKADYVISGIPFSTMPAELRESIVRATRDALRPDGAFLVYQFSRGVEPSLERTFSRVRKDFEARNIPPARLWYCTP